jgi:hypothetical protein
MPPRGREQSQPHVVNQYAGVGGYNRGGGWGVSLVAAASPSGSGPQLLVCCARGVARSARNRYAP